LVSVNLLKNDIGVEQALAIVKIKEAKPNLKTLCGFTLEETELDMSRQGLRKPEDAVLLASDIPDMGSLSKLTLFGGHWSTPVTFEIGMTEVDFSGTRCTEVQFVGSGGAIILAAWLEHKV
jgi:hypothetical protein